MLSLQLIQGISKPTLELIQNKFKKYNYSNVYLNFIDDDIKANHGQAQTNYIPCFLFGY